jgi:hypothetical protein
MGFMGCKAKTTGPIISVVKDSSENNVLSQEPDTSELIAMKTLHSVAIKDLFCQHWEMEDADREHWNEIFWDSVNNKRKYPSLHLFNDFSVTENPRTDIRLGRWSLNQQKRQLRLTFNDGNIKEYFIDRITVSGFNAIWKKGEGIEIQFLADNLVHKVPDQDPFYPSNNLWRIKPTTAENSAQIRKRMINFVHFYALYFKDNRQRKASDISFIGLPNCFTWYNGGIALQANYEVDQKWLNCFYSEAQAMQGYGLLKSVIEKHNLKWPKGAGSWIEELQSVLAQIQDQL